MYSAHLTRLRDVIRPPVFLLSSCRLWASLPLSLRLLTYMLIHISDLQSIFMMSLHPKHYNEKKTTKSTHDTIPYPIDTGGKGTGVIKTSQEKVAVLIQIQLSGYVHPPCTHPRTCTLTHYSISMYMLVRQNAVIKCPTQARWFANASHADMCSTPIQWHR